MQKTLVTPKSTLQVTKDTNRKKLRIDEGVEEIKIIDPSLI